MISKKHITILISLAFFQLSYSSEVWSSSDQEEQGFNRDDFIREKEDEFNRFDPNDTIFENEENLNNLQSQLDEKSKEIKKQDATTIAEQEDRNKNAQLASREDFSNHTFNLYAEYVYLKTKFVDNLINPKFIKYQGETSLSHHYPYAQSRGSIVLPNTNNKIIEFKNNYYTAKARDLISDAMSRENIEKNKGEVIYQSDDPKNSLNLSNVLSITSKGNQSTADYMQKKSEQMQKEHSFIPSKPKRTTFNQILSGKAEDLKHFDGIINRMQEDLASKIKEIAKTEAIAANPDLWHPVNSCRTLICFAGGSGSGCAKQIPAYIRQTTGVTPADTAAKQAAWFKMCATSMAGEENMAVVLAKSISDAVRIFKFNQPNNSSNSNPSDTGINTGILEIEKIEELDKFSKDSQSSLTGLIYYGLKGAPEECEINYYNTAYKASKYNMNPSKKILFNYGNSKNNSISNPFLMVEAYVKDDRISKLCQNYLDHPYVSAYSMPIYKRWEPYNLKTSNNNLLINNWLSREAFQQYENRLRCSSWDGSSSICRTVNANHLFGDYYKYVPEQVIRMVHGKNTETVRSYLNNAKSNPELQYIRQSSSFEEFMISRNFKHPVYDFLSQRNYYYGKWEYVPNYLQYCENSASNENCIVSPIDILFADKENSWNIEALKKEDQEYNLKDENRARNKKIVLEIIDEYQKSK